MKVTPPPLRGTPLVSLSTYLGGGGSGSQPGAPNQPPAPSGHVPFSTGSNAVAWGSNVAIITSNGSNQVTGPFVNFASGSGISFAVASNTLTISGGGGSGLPWFDVKQTYGAAGDGVTDDTAEVQAAIDAAAAAGGGVVYFRAGVYLIGGALQDTSRSNSQLRLPSKDAVDDEQIAIHLLGEFPPPPIFSVVGATPLPDEQVVIKGTLTSVSGTSPSLLGGWGPAGSYADFTFLQLRIENITFRLPENPVYSALDLSHVTGVDLENVICDVSDYQIQGITEPTTSTSYGIRLPAVDNGAYTRLGAVNVAGYYYGIQVGEHTTGQQVTCWGCKVGVQTVAGYHASKFDRLMFVHCERGLQASGGIHYLTIDQLNVEHAASGWWVTDEDVDDPSNYLYGWAHWKVTLAGVGHDSTWTVDGATNFHMLEIGDDPFLVSPLTTKGDLWSYTTTDARFAVGSNGTVPIADSTQAVGLRYSYNAPSGELLISDTPAGSPLVFGDILQNELQDDLLYGDL